MESSYWFNYLSHLIALYVSLTSRTLFFFTFFFIKLKPRIAWNLYLSKKLLGWLVGYLNFSFLINFFISYQRKNLLGWQSYFLLSCCCCYNLVLFFLDRQWLILGVGLFLMLTVIQKMFSYIRYYTFVYTIGSIVKLWDLDLIDLSRPVMLGIVLKLCDHLLCYLWSTHLRIVPNFLFWFFVDSDSDQHSGQCKCMMDCTNISLLLFIAFVVKLHINVLREFPWQNRDLFSL